MNRVLQLIEEHPAEIAGAAIVGALTFLVLMRLFKIRIGFPALLFGCLLFILAGSTGIARLQVLSKGALRWLGLAAIASAILIYGIRAGKAVNRPTAAHWLWLSFLALAFCTAPMSTHPTFSLLSCVAVMVLFCAAFGAVWYYASGTRELVELVEAMQRLALLVLVAGFALVVMARGQAIVAGRLTGFFNNANWNGIFSALMLPIALWQYQYPRHRFEKRLSLLLVALLGLNILASGSRGSICAGFVAAVLAQWRLDRAKLFRYAFLFMLLLGLVLVTEAGPWYLETGAERLARLNRAATLTHRTEMWVRAWPTIRQNLLCGVGLGNSRFILMTKGAEEEAATQIGGTAANLHSQHVVLLAETGILGYAIFWVFLGSMCRLGLRAWRAPRSPLNDLTFALFCSFLVAFGDSFLHGWMFSAGSSLALLFWSLVALCLKSERLAKTERAPRSEAHAGRTPAENAKAPSSRPDRIAETARCT
jgi:O-antigen ligase